jgi:hypothetical protein
METADKEALSGDLADANLLFITLDSLRLDVARMASLPVLASLEGPTPCYTHANFTLPAHFAFFTGFLPLPLDSKYRFLRGRFSRIFRPVSARPAPGQVAISFSGATVISSFQDAGAVVVGTGGVPYFDPDSTQISFASLFPEFHYSGYPARSDFGDGRTFAEAARYSSLVLLRDWLAQALIDPFRQYLLFANEPSTHFPFVCPSTALTSMDEKYLWEFDKYVRLKQPVPERLAAQLQPWGMDRQRVILEWLDSLIGEVLQLLTRLRRRTLVVVCSDHGEAFGENDRVGHFLNLDVVLHVPLWTAII